MAGWILLGSAGVPKTPQVDDADQQPVRLLQVCGTTPCMLQGARKIYAAIKERLGIDYGETTPVGEDGCCRACGLEAEGSRGLWLGCATGKPVCAKQRPSFVGSDSSHASIRCCSSRNKTRA